MAAIYIERHEITPGLALTWDMAYHLFTRYKNGPVLVITENPGALMPALRKQWLKVIAKLRSEYARTLDKRKRALIASYIKGMEALEFLAAIPQDTSRPDVFIISFEQEPQITLQFHTIYVTDFRGTDHREKLSRHVLKGGLYLEYIKTNKKD